MAWRRIQQKAAAVSSQRFASASLEAVARPGNTLIAVLEKNHSDIPDVPDGWARVNYSSAGKDSILDVFRRVAGFDDKGVTIAWLTPASAALLLMEYEGLSPDPIGVYARRISLAQLSSLPLSLVVPTQTHGELLLAATGGRGKPTGAPSWTQGFGAVSYISAGEETSNKASLMVAEANAPVPGKYGTVAAWAETIHSEGLLLAFREEGQERPPEPPYFEPTQFNRTLTGLFTEHVTISPGEVVKIEGTATFDNKSLIVEGTLVMRPGSRLRFVNVNEGGFVGASPAAPAAPVNPETDPGLLVRGDGVLDLQGTPVAPWNRTGDDPSWLDTDELPVAPILPGDYAPNGFPLFRRGDPVPMSPRGHFAEVLNLTRDIVVEGTPGGRAHIHIHTHGKPHIIKNVEIRYMGVPGKLGRYGLHLHHGFESTIGTVIENVVVSHGGNHGFVAHSSSGVIHRGCITYDIQEEAFWWDPGDPTDDLVWENCLAGWTRGTGPRTSSFHLGNGAPLTMVCRGCVSVGLQGGSESPGAHWPEAGSRSGIWVFESFTAHNNRRGGITVWQNVHTHPHNIDGLYYQLGESGINHGAYTTQGYHYHDVVIEDAPVGLIQHAISRAGFPTRPDGYGLSFERMTIRGCPVGVRITRHQAPSEDVPVLYKNLVFESNGVKVQVHEIIGGNHFLGWEDFVDCGIDPFNDIQIVSMVAGSRIRIQEGLSAWRLDSTGVVTEIAPFYALGDPPPPPPPPVAFFVPSSTAIMAGESVQFFNQSSYASRYEWTLAPGVTSSAPNPSHIYSAPGDYLVTLTAFNLAGVQGQFSTLISVAAVPLPPPTLAITSPTPSQTIEGDTVTVRYTTAGDLTEVNHAHLQLDGDPEIRDLDFDGVYTFSGVPAGAHTLTGYLARADHSKVAGTDAGPVTFNVVVSPTGDIAVPDMVGLTEAAAAATLTALGLNAAVTRQASATVPAGEVISQFPARDTALAPGSLVMLVVSTGPEPPSPAGDSSGVVLLIAGAVTLYLASRGRKK